MIYKDFLDFTSEMSRGIAIDFGVDFAIDLPRILPRILPPILPGKLTKAPTPAKPPQKWPPATRYARKSLRSLPYASSWLQNLRIPHLTLIFRDVCALKSSRSPPYAATRNFCTLRIFYKTACSIFGTPKCSTCGMSLICGAPKFSIWDMKKFQGLTYRTFRTSVML